MYRILKFVIASFRVDSILLTEGSILRDLGLTLLVIIGRHLTDQASCKMGTRSFPGVRCFRGVLLTTHPPPTSAAVMESRAKPLPTLWATLGL